MTPRKQKPLETCIYCGVTGSNFSREHVLSEALGHFKGAQTLRCVCSDCNAYFANSLELGVYRDSNEAVLRLVHGIKSPVGALQLGTDRTTLRSLRYGNSNHVLAATTTSHIQLLASSREYGVTFTSGITMKWKH